jgi:hypothetical protein
MVNVLTDTLQFACLSALVQVLSCAGAAHTCSHALSRRMQAATCQLWGQRWRLTDSDVWHWLCPMVQDGVWVQAAATACGVGQGWYCLLCDCVSSGPSGSAAVKRNSCRAQVFVQHPD